MTTKPKASHAPSTDTQAAQAAEGAGQAAHTAAAAATATGYGAALAVADPEAPAQAAPPVHNPKRGGLYRQVGGEQPTTVHRTLQQHEADAKATQPT
ncbi:MAG: hypothetical protein PHU77_00465 [Simplicispira sp.]|nr:hypothetical protein [Simplicispira sp.]